MILVVLLPCILNNEINYHQSNLTTNSHSSHIFILTYYLSEVVTFHLTPAQVIA